MPQMRSVKVESGNADLSSDTLFSVIDTVIWSYAKHAQMVHASRIQSAVEEARAAGSH